MHAPIKGRRATLRCGQENDMTDVYEEILRIKQEGKDGVLVTVVAKDGHGPAAVGTKLLAMADGRKVGTVGGGALEYAALSKASQVLNDKRDRLKKYSLSPDNDLLDGEQTGMLCGGSVTLFYEYIGSGVRLYIFGAGHIGQAIVRHISQLNYYITIIDNREGMADIVTAAQRRITANYKSVIKDEQIPGDSFFLIATHSHSLDYQILKRLYEEDLDPKYIGLIASRRKTPTLLERLREDLGAGINLDVLYSPIGLDIGGRSPDEIAISIIAELQAVRYNKKDHKHMKNLRDK